MKSIYLSTLCAAFFFWSFVCLAENPFNSNSSLLKDNNGDGIISFLGFGNSLVFGVGDGTLPGTVVNNAPRTDGTAGFVPRIKSILGIQTTNKGVPGELFTEGGISRLPTVVASSGADIVGLLEGSNDANMQVSPSEYQTKLQRAVNTIKAMGKDIVLVTLPPPCCNHEGLEFFTRAYNNKIKEIAKINDLRIADAERAWINACPIPSKCELHNLPEGLHPNTKGYDVIAQSIMAAFLGIDVFSAEGGQLLEESLGLEPGTVIVVPDH